jgi:hypothetical protein
MPVDVIRLAWRAALALNTPVTPAQTGFFLHDTQYLARILAVAVPAVNPPQSYVPGTGICKPASAKKFRPAGSPAGRQLSSGKSLPKQQQLPRNPEE